MQDHNNAQYIYIYMDLKLNGQTKSDIWIQVRAHTHMYVCIIPEISIVR